MTGFFGYSTNGHGITTFDWNTLEYTKHVPELTGNRISSSCALLNGENEEKWVAIASGYSSGMEAWNPNNGIVKNLTFNFPHPFNQEYGQMISIQHGDQLVLYTGTEIWNYFGSNNSWIKLGYMLQSRVDFVALPVKKISCN